MNKKTLTNLIIGSAFTAAALAGAYGAALHSNRQKHNHQYLGENTLLVSEADGACGQTEFERKLGEYTFHLSDSVTKVGCFGELTSITDGGYYGSMDGIVDDIYFGRTKMRWVRERDYAWNPAAFNAADLELAKARQRFAVPLSQWAPQQESLERKAAARRFAAEARQAAIKAYGAASSAAGKAYDATLDAAQKAKRELEQARHSLEKLFNKK